MSRDLDQAILQALAEGAISVDVEAGTVWRGERQASGRPTDKGYLQVSIGRGRLAYIHRIVWLAAHGAIRPDLTIDHLNGKMADNRISNLEAVGRGENTRRRLHLHHNPYLVRDAFGSMEDLPDSLAEAVAMADRGASRVEIAAFMAAHRAEVEDLDAHTRPA